MTAAFASLHERLRVETRSLHEELERAVDIDSQLVSTAATCGYLVRLRGLHASAETRLDAFDFMPFGFDYRGWRRSRLIEDDLDCLGFGRDRLFAQPLPPAPVLSSAEAALGCVYVVEGSAIGARAILPQIKIAVGS